MTNWQTVRYLKTPWQATDDEAVWEYVLELPEPLANWDVFSYWERERVLSMRDNLMQSDVLFDVGAEHGWMSAVFSKMCNVFLIEPTPEFWPNIKATWERNTDKKPAGCFHGLVGSETNFTEKIDFSNFPDVSNGDLIDKNKYIYLHDQTESKIITLNDLEYRSGVQATAITIDVEGAELFVLQGATNLLKRGVKVWVSIHDDLMRQYNHKPEDVIDFMHKHGYKAQHLATDHEAHYFFTK